MRVGPCLVRLVIQVEVFRNGRPGRVRCAGYLLGINIRGRKDGEGGRIGQRVLQPGHISVNPTPEFSRAGQTHQSCPPGVSGCSFTPLLFAHGPRSS